MIYLVYQSSTFPTKKEWSVYFRVKYKFAFLTLAYLSLLPLQPPQTLQKAWTKELNVVD